MMISESISTIAIKAALEAGKAVMEVYNTNFETELKPDGSPITLADKRANAIICSALEETGISIISEESPEEDYELRNSHEYTWLVDPVDGTKEFTNRNNEFTVNIALIHNQEPVFGIVTAPAINEAWVGWTSKGAYKLYNPDALADQLQHLGLKELMENSTEIHTQANTNDPVFTISRSHLTQNTKNMIQTLFGDIRDLHTLPKGSSLKFCMLAEGKAQYYLRADTIHEWDTAAGHAILLAAGGKIITWPMADRLLYNKESLINPGFIAFANPDESDRLKSKFPA